MTCVYVRLLPSVPSSNNCALTLRAPAKLGQLQLSIGVHSGPPQTISHLHPSPNTRARLRVYRPRAKHHRNLVHRPPSGTANYSYRLPRPPAASQTSVRTFEREHGFVGPPISTSDAANLFNALDIEAPYVLECELVLDPVRVSADDRDPSPLLRFGTSYRQASGARRVDVSRRGSAARLPVAKRTA